MDGEHRLSFFPSTDVLRETTCGFPGPPTLERMAYCLFILIFPYTNRILFCEISTVLNIMGGLFIYHY